MPRFARLHAPGSVFHVIARFVNKEFRLQTNADRALYLAGVPQALRWSDWRPLAYALMSSHIHWVLYAGEAPLSTFIKPLHTRFAALHNRRCARLGPVFAGRPCSVLVEDDIARLLAYVHNNPVRADLVSDPAASSWTSHRAYIGVAKAPPWLDVELGLRLLGMNMMDREAFHQLVLSHVDEARSSLLSGGDLHRVRRQIRAEVRKPIELSSPQAVPSKGQLMTLVCMPATQPNLHRMPPLDRLLARVADWLGFTPLEVQGGSKQRPFAHARRIFIEAATKVGYSITEASATVGISVSAARGLLQRSEDRRAQLEVVNAILDQTG